MQGVVRARKPTAARQRIINGKRITSTDWAALRNRWQARLPQPCPRCDRDGMPWDAWELDHVGVHTAMGATDSEKPPTHQARNRRAGAQLGSDLARLGAAVARGMDPGQARATYLTTPGGGVVPSWETREKNRAEKSDPVSDRAVSTLA